MKKRRWKQKIRQEKDLLSAANNSGIFNLRIGVKNVAVRQYNSDKRKHNEINN